MIGDVICDDLITLIKVIINKFALSQKTFALDIEVFIQLPLYSDFLSE